MLHHPIFLKKIRVALESRTLIWVPDLLTITVNIKNAKSGVGLSQVSTSRLRTTHSSVLKNVHPNQNWACYVIYLKYFLEKKMLIILR